MEKAIKIVEEMKEKCHAELDRLYDCYSRTRPLSIYDASYREMLVQMKDREMVKLNLLKELEIKISRLEDEE